MFSKEVSELLKELKEYRTEHDIEDGGYVFVGTKINGAWMPITSSTAGDWCKKIGEMINELRCIRMTSGIVVLPC